MKRRAPNKGKRTAARITGSSLQGRNTSASTPASRITPAAAGMRASAQLDAFPTSDNARARQSHWRKAVVSIRLSGETIQKLDDEAKRMNKEGEGASWRDTTRADVINRAIARYLAAVKS